MCVVIKIILPSLHQIPILIFYQGPVLLAQWRPEYQGDQSHPTPTINKTGKGVLRNVVHRITFGILWSLLGLNGNEMKINESPISNFNQYVEGFWDTWKIPFMALCKPGSVMEQCR
jgi:hypothetical protein